MKIQIEFDTEKDKESEWIIDALGGNVGLMQALERRGNECKEIEDRYHKERMAREAAEAKLEEVKLGLPHHRDNLRSALDKAEFLFRNYATIDRPRFIDGLNEIVTLLRGI